MIRKVVKKGSIDSFSSVSDDLQYWLSKTPAERIAVVEFLRIQNHGSSIRLQRTVRVIQQTRG
jgi:hypothetical protein